MSWSTTTIADICSLVTSGGTPTSTNESYYYPPEIPWLRTGEVNYCRIYDTEKHISQEGLANSSAKLIPANSVIIAMYGQGDTAGRVAINKVPITTNQACCNLVIDENKADYEFVYYALCTMYDKMVSLKNGGAQPNLNGKIIKSLEIPFPDLPTQHRIASILSAYDDLIENNRRQIKLLEEAAQRLYREWFVELRFPGHEGVKVVDGVPEGWKQCSMEDIAQYINGYAFKPSDWKNEGKPIIKIKELNDGVTKDTPRNKGVDIPHKYHIKAGDILFSWSATLTAMIWDDEDGLLNQHLFKVIPNEGISREFVLQAILKALLEFQNLTTGSTMKHIQRGKLAQVNLVVPDGGMMTMYQQQSEPVREKILALKRQIILLTKVRDRLLPKLMSGEMEF